MRRLWALPALTLARQGTGRPSSCMRLRCSIHPLIGYPAGVSCKDIQLKHAFLSHSGGQPLIKLRQFDYLALLQAWPATPPAATFALVACAALVGQQCGLPAARLAAGLSIAGRNLASHTLAFASLALLLHHGCRTCRGSSRAAGPATTLHQVRAFFLS